MALCCIVIWCLIYFFCQDVNDNPPVFNPTSYETPNQVLENVVPGTEILTVHASDADGQVALE